MSFFALRDEAKSSLFFCIIFSKINFNSYAQLFGASIYGAPLERLAVDLIWRQGGILRQHFYISDISLIAFFGVLASKYSFE